VELRRLEGCLHRFSFDGVRRLAPTLYSLRYFLGCQRRRVMRYRHGQQAYSSRPALLGHQVGDERTTMGGHTVNGVQQLAPSDEPFVVGSQPRIRPDRGEHGHPELRPQVLEPSRGVTPFDDAHLVEHRRPLDQACDDLPIELRHRRPAACAHRERAVGVAADVLAGELPV
jgi:hypothetical protein